MSAAVAHAYDDWLKVEIEEMEFVGQVRSCDTGGVVVNVQGLGQRRVKHAEVLGPCDPPAAVSNGRAPEPAVIPRDISADEVLTLPLAAVEPFARNPRQFKKLADGSVDPDQHGLRELAASLAALGQQQPIIVRALGEDRYSLVDGERRYHATAIAGLKTLRAVVRELTDEEALAATVAASNHSEPYGIRDRARAVSWLLGGGRTQQEVAELLGINQPSVSVLQRVFSLPGPVQEFIEQGLLSFGHVRMLVRDHLVRHPKIVTRIAELAVEQEAPVKALECEIPFEALLPAEMLRALRPQPSLAMEDMPRPQRTVTETHTETNKTVVTTGSPAAPAEAEGPASEPFTDEVSEAEQPPAPPAAPEAATAPAEAPASVPVAADEPAPEPLQVIAGPPDDAPGKLCAVTTDCVDWIAASGLNVRGYLWRLKNAAYTRGVDAATLLAQLEA